MVIYLVSLIKGKDLKRAGGISANMICVIPSHTDGSRTTLHVGVDRLQS